MIQVRLEKSATLWCDNSALALNLQKDLENKVYILDVHLSESQTPLLDYDNFF